MKRRYSVLLLIILLIGSIAVPTMAQSDAPDRRYIGETEAPAFPTGVDWLNVENPLTIDDLSGKMILLDFWTYGCINCIHMMPVLRQLEERFAEELVVIGVHSGKFEGEQITENLQQIVQRYQIEHPVINDEDFLVWRTFGASAWPTFLLLDPNGNVLAAQAGEVPYQAFETYISNAIEYYDNNPTFAQIDRTPIELVLEGAGNPGTALAFPGKVLADADSNRLFIADTNHHRIVIADLITYEVLDIIGTGERGYNDGSYNEVTFDQPQGMELVDNVLYIADVNNHVIRAINLNQQTVTTVAGTGAMGRTSVPFSVVINDPLSFDFRSPWDVALGQDDILYIAMAGTHQIWQLDLAGNVLRAAVGNAREAQLSTTLANSELAQPSGLHWHEGSLYFADSESSTVRVAEIFEDRVAVIAGTTRNDLFTYGDEDGTIGESLLQHPLGVTGNEEGSIIYIADTYNNKIKQFDVATGTTTTLFGLGGNGGYLDGNSAEAQFDEPGGLDYADGRLYVADTNNHAIRIIDLASQRVSTLQFANPQSLIIERDEPTILGGNAAQGIQLTLDPQTVTSGNVELSLQFNLPEGYKINELTDSTVEVSDNDLVALPAQDNNRIIITETTSTISLTLTEGETTLALTIALFYCEEDSYCLIDDVQIAIPLIIQADAPTQTINVTREVQLPAILTDDA